MTAPRRTAALLITALALAASGCGAGEVVGDGSAKGDNELATTDSATVQEASRTIDTFCGTDGTNASTGTSSAADLSGAVKSLADLTKGYPNAVYETGNVARSTRLRDFTAELAKQLKTCGINDQAAILEQASKAT